MCHRCVLAAAITSMPTPTFVGVDYAKDTPEADQQAQTQEVNHQASTQADRPESMVETIRRLEKNCEQLRQANRGLVEELDRATDLKHKYAREAQIAKKFAKILTADMAPQL